MLIADVRGTGIVMWGRRMSVAERCIIKDTKMMSRLVGVVITLFRQCRGFGKLLGGVYIRGTFDRYVGLVRYAPTFHDLNY